MSKRGYKLGLHTMEEQAYALRKANEAYDAAVKALRTGDFRMAFYLSGYLQAIYDLAIDEGAYGLAKGVAKASEDLRRLITQAGGA